MVLKQSCIFLFFLPRDSWHSSFDWEFAVPLLGPIFNWSFLLEERKFFPFKTNCILSLSLQTTAALPVFWSSLLLGISLSLAPPYGDFWWMTEWALHYPSEKLWSVKPQWTRGGIPATYICLFGFGFYGGIMFYSLLKIRSFACKHE